MRPRAHRDHGLNVCRAFGVCEDPGSYTLNKHSYKYVFIYLFAFMIEIKSNMAM